VTRAEALRAAQARLTDAGVETPALDAKILLLHVEDVDVAALMADPDATLRAPDAFESVIVRRCNREPVSKIIGYRDFWAHQFEVTPDVLDPRPDTETLIETALEITPDNAPIRVLDLGTGSGCILLTLLAERSAATGVGVDMSKAALSVAKRNAAALKLSQRSEFLISDWFMALDETFDVVVSNPPYISTLEKPSLSPEVTDWDPEAALFAGMDGLQAYRKIADGLTAVLKPDGTAFFEIGRGQGEAVKRLFEDAGFRRISSRKDLGGIERCLVVQR